jgi:hypothetical protein
VSAGQDRPQESGRVRFLEASDFWKRCFDQRDPSPASQEQASAAPAGYLAIYFNYQEAGLSA